MRHLLVAMLLLATVAGPAEDLDREVDAILRNLCAAAGWESRPCCDDATFLRRLSLDVRGRLPSPAEIRAFLADRDPGKRATAIDAALADPGYVDRFGLLWGDILRIKAEFPANLWPLAAQAYDAWVRQALRTGLPYDRFAAALLTASGSNFRRPEVNFYRTCPERSAEAYAAQAAQVFLGIRWDRCELPGKAGFIAAFSGITTKPSDEWKEEFILWNRQAPARCTGLDGKNLAVAEERDPRQAIAAWIVSADNPWFARAHCDRAWAWLLGRGLHASADNLSSPCASPALLDLLAQDFVRSGFDQRQVLRRILRSRAYQAGSGPAEVPGAGFASYPLRRLDAEVLLDAINQVLHGRERYVSRIPEPFTVLPATQRAQALPDASITSSALTLFGRPPRNTSLSAERDSSPTLEQVRHLLNASHINDKLQRSAALRRLAETRSGGSTEPRRLVELIYLHVLSRLPEPAERDLAVTVLGHDGQSEGGLEDLVWALLNSSEFVLRH